MRIKLFLICLLFINSVLAQTEFECGMEENVYQVFPRGYVFNPPQVGGRYAPAKTLNGEIFDNILEARVITEKWREHYNKIRPHSSLNFRPPVPEVMIPHQYASA